MSGFRPGRFDALDHTGHLEVEADVIVLGAGAGGSALATAVAERGLTVAILEEGNHWRPEDFRPDTTFALRNLYQSRGLRSARGNTVMPLPGGRGVGGSTLINSAICFRTPDAVLDDWTDRCGLEGLTPERFAPHFDRIWATLGVTVQSLEVQRLNNTVFRDGAEALGLNGAFMARSAPGCVGCGICQYGCPTGGKASVDRTFLVEAEATGNLAVHAGCRMDLARTQGDRVTALTGTRLHPVTQEPIGTVTARGKAFVVAGGPIGSPTFLLKNGLADPEHCGNHLVVHPTVPGLARFPFEIRPWHGVTQGYYVDCWDEGYLLQTYTTTPDQYYAVLPAAVGEEAMQFMADLAFMGSAGTLVHDEDSSGRVRMTVAGPDISYHLGPEDTKRLVRGLRRVGEVFFAAGAEVFLPARIGGGPIPRGSDLAKALPLDLAPHHLQTYASHPMGTCRMSARPADGVVDARGRVWGWSNLHVADASVFPTGLGVNPQVTTMALALNIGQQIEV